LVTPCNDSGTVIQALRQHEHGRRVLAQLKRSINGTHHHVSIGHLHRYVREFDFRYSTCKMSDYGRMRTLAGQMEGRLSYKRLAAN
jgi:hypothetical protein